MLAGSFAVARQGLDVFSSRFSSNKVEEHGFTGRYLQTWMLPFTVMDRAEAGGAGVGNGDKRGGGSDDGQADVSVLGGRRGTDRFGERTGDGGWRTFCCGCRSRFTWGSWRGGRCASTRRRCRCCFSADVSTTCCRGSVSQPTELGFATIAGGLCLTESLRAGEPLPEEAEAAAAEVEMVVVAAAAAKGQPGRAVTAAGATEAARLGSGVPVAKVTPRIPPARVTPRVPTAAARGRSAYAERLHASEVKGTEGGEASRAGVSSAEMKRFARESGGCAAALPSCSEIANHLRTVWRLKPRLKPMAPGGHHPPRNSVQAADATASDGARNPSSPTRDTKNAVYSELSGKCQMRQAQRLEKNLCFQSRPKF